MSSPIRTALLLWGLSVVLGACGSDSSTSVLIKVDNSVDGQDTDPNLIIAVVVRDDDDVAGVIASQPASLEAARFEAAVEAAREEPPADRPEAELAYLALGADGNPRGIAIASETGEIVAQIGSDALAGFSEPTWSLDQERLVFVGTDGLYASQALPGDANQWSDPERISALWSASAADSGPPLEVRIDGDLAVFEVILAIAPASPGASEDVFAIFVDSGGEVLGHQNLTHSLVRRELDVTWLHDGARIAVLERSDVDAIVLYDISFDVVRDGRSELSLRAELAPTGGALWDAQAGSLGEVSAARTRDLLAVSAWTGRDWDVLCIDTHGNAVNLGSAALDEVSPSWSSDDGRLAVEQRCAGAACTPLPILIWELDHPDDLERCPEVARVQELRDAGASPAWRR